LKYISAQNEIIAQPNWRMKKWLLEWNFNSATTEEAL
jgi:hypothetical protein